MTKSTIRRPGDGVRLREALTDRSSLPRACPNRTPVKTEIVIEWPGEARDDQFDDRGGLGMAVATV